MTFTGGVSLCRMHSRMTWRYLEGNSFIITPPFSPSAIWVTMRRDVHGQFKPARQSLGLVVRLHLGDELGVAALGLDDGDDAGFLAAGIAGRPGGAGCGGA